MEHALIVQLRLAATREARQSLVDTWARQHPGAELRKVSLAGCNLEGLHLARLEMSEIDFRRSCCVDSCLPPLAGCNLNGVDARGARFLRLADCTFNDSILDEAEFGGWIGDCDFRRASMIGARISEIVPQNGESWKLGRNNFSKANCRWLDAAGAILTDCVFTETSLEYARLSRCNLKGSVWHRAHLTGTNMVNSLVDSSLAKEAVARDCARKPGRATRELSVVLKQCVEFGIRWTMRRRGSFAEEGVVLRRATPSKSFALQGATLRLPSRAILRIIPASGKGSLGAIASEVSADYEGWFVLMPTVEIAGIAQGYRRAVHAAVVKMLSELFQSDSVTGGPTS